MPPEPLARSGSPGLYGRGRDSQQPRDPRRQSRRKSADAGELAAVMGHGGKNGFIAHHADVESANGKRGHFGGTGLWRGTNGSPGMVPLGLAATLIIGLLMWSRTSGSACGLFGCTTHSLPDMVRALGDKPALSELRKLGESTAALYPGYVDMGMSPVKQTAYMPMDEAAARESCAPTGTSNTMVVLVTGTGGFIGAATALKLKGQGHGVLGLDNFCDYYPVALKRARQARLVAAGVYTVDGDINDRPLLDSLFAMCSFSHVLHLAAQAGVRYATQNPFSYVHANLDGHVSILEAVKAQDPMPVVVYASSSSVYGLNMKQPFSERDRVEQPASLYASTKRADELISHTYHNIYGMSLTGLRFFTVYGPWGRPDMAAFKFAKNIMMGVNITVFQGPKDTELSRDFTFIDDIVSGVIASLVKSKPSVKGKAQYKIYNLGNTNPHTVTELVDLLERGLNRKAKRNLIPMPATGDVLATFADISAAKADLGYAPKTSLAEGVNRFCDWFFKYYNLERDGAPVPESRFAADWAYNPLR